MDEAPKSFIEYECKDGIAIITLNKPEKLNAFDDNMVKELDAALNHFDMDENAHVAILHGKGRAFSSGADVHARQLRSKEDLAKRGGPAARDARSAELLIRAINWKPVIAAVHGYAMGLALALAMECDLVVAETGAKFQVSETPRGLAPPRYWALLNFRGNGGFATDVTLTGRFFTAEEGLAGGVVDRVAPKGAYLDVARELAAAIAKNPPLAVRAGVRTRRWRMEQVEGEAIKQASLDKLYLSEDFAEAARAFAEKRPAGPFKGR